MQLDGRHARTLTAARRAAVAALVCALCACGGASAPAGVQAAVDDDWVRNVRSTIGQLQRDAELSAVGGGDERTAHAALHDESSLYALLIAYSDFAGCGRMVQNAGAASPRFVGVERTLRRACRRLERAAALFTRSNTGAGAPALVAATRDVAAASLLLSRASVQLAVVRSSGA